ncbi:hypothetical protein Agabi119p4_4955 [Agaricus bisporus var. burnettii]|uniref:Major facilitator superfamily (MFS) profile domain-containing protein n=1 Tax=Agaricus bisporus var. burnettii TaxID=192524 RepID=A0A8H7F4D3_AGABI|nr:hypothetical protein Agabi119p4_4955 [Agaricus bisporus var. burnettii]
MVAPSYPKARRRLVGQALLYAISMFASLAVFLFGYDQGVMSGIISDSSLVPTLITFLLDRMRFRLERWSPSSKLVPSVSSLVSPYTDYHLKTLQNALRCGCGVGLLSTIVPIYQSEISPPNHRGALACVEFTGNVFGYAFSVWTDYFCSFIDSDFSWRIPLFFQCIIGIILALGSLVMPESPRWLIYNSRNEDGLRVIADLHGGDLDNEKAVLEFEEIREKVLQELSLFLRLPISLRMMWRKYKQRVLLAMSSQAFAQLNGISVISYYAPRVFEEAGWVGRDAILMTGINAIVYLLSTLPPWILVDRWGRRPILLSGAAIMSLSLFATGYWIFLNKSWTPNAVVVSVVLFNVAFGYSWGPILWLYPPEIMPLTVRAKGVSLSTATNWAFNFFVGEATPYLQEHIEYRLYYMHGFYCIYSFILVYFLYPETKGVPLEEIDQVFGEQPFRDHIPLRVSMETSPTSDERRYPPKPLVLPNRKRGWFSRLLRRPPSHGRETPEYRTLSGVADDEEELRQFKVEDDDEEEPEEYEMVGGQKHYGGSGGSHSQDRS